MDSPFRRCTTVVSCFGHTHRMRLQIDLRGWYRAGVDVHRKTRDHCGYAHSGREGKLADIETLRQHILPLSTTGILISRDFFCLTLPMPGPVLNGR